jgi:hypothetical protein
MSDVRKDADGVGVRIEMTWGKILVICSSFFLTCIAGVLAIGHFWLDSMDRNISELHGDFAQVSHDTGDLKGLLGGERSVDLIKEIADTHLQVVKLGDRFDTDMQKLGDKIDMTNYKLSDVAENMKSLRGDIGDVRSYLLNKKQ